MNKEIPREFNIRQKTHNKRELPFLEQGDIRYYTFALLNSSKGIHNPHENHSCLQSQLGEKKSSSVLSLTNIFVWYLDYLNPKFQKNQMRALKENPILSFFTIRLGYSRHAKSLLQLPEIGVRYKNNDVQCDPHDHYKKKVSTFITYIELYGQSKPHLQNFTICKAYSLHRRCYHQSCTYSSMFVIKVGTFLLKVVMGNKLDTIFFTCNIYFWQLQQ